MSGCNMHFELPQSLVLNANDRMHWAPRNRVVGNLRAMGRRAAGDCAPMDRAHLTIQVGYATNHKRDDHNFMPTYKALIDGIVGDGGLLPGDDRAHLTGPDLRSYVAKRAGLLVLDFEFVEVTT